MIEHGLNTRRLLTAVGCVLLLVGPTHSVKAAFVSFDDAVSGQPYVLPDTFTSEGVDFTVEVYNPPAGGLVEVQVGPTPFGDAPGTDPAAYPNNLNLNMDLVGSIGQQSFVRILFTDNGGSVNLGINGPPVEEPDFFVFNTTSMNGVSIDVTSLPGTSRGMIELRGPVDKVIFGGQETIFDDILAVPEPSTFMLFAGLAAIGLFTSRGRCVV